ncbi:penicillin-binding transpeptidase domain-containing protein [Lentzea kentuckyensis]|uniref:penicillin-binding transpeptidase domain-containing protein n=1 Tax=Lentzea kentuckyensis TaxID=360086 RepID=UPI001302BB33|nr:penicillin-binding transpeptidase domain-containing protein [Lentzea kentuckyensis]
MKRLLPVLGALVLVGAVVAVVVWQRSDAAPPASVPLKDFVVQYADGSTMWNSKDGDPKSPLVQQVLADVRQQASILPDQLRQVGGVVVTTIDPKAQAAGVAAIAQGQSATPRSLTAVDPATGGVVAYVPGADPAVDFAGGVLKEPGTAFLPIDVVAALQNGKTLDSTFDGSSPRKVAGVLVRNKGNVQLGKQTTLREAFAKSSEVVMYDLISNQVSIRPAVTAARQAGVPETVVVAGQEKKLLVGEGGGLPNAGIAVGGDQAAMRPLDLTTVYATFAAGGVHHKTHFVTKITAESGDLLYKAVESTSSAFDPDGARSKAIAEQVTTVLKDNTLCPGAVCRTATYEPAPDKPSSHVWTVGYTGRMAITVLAGGPDAELPRNIWQKFVEQT